MYGGTWDQAVLGLLEALQTGLMRQVPQKIGLGTSTKVS
jgi:hypothetical protein